MQMYIAVKVWWWENNVFGFIIEHIKISKKDQEESARKIISRGLCCKAGIRGRVTITFTLTREIQEKKIILQKFNYDLFNIRQKQW